ncbi:MAG: phosphatase PAP2 family protein [Spirochaetia bacterium]|nr:phosphatase PAP2 family protein [Spirochaetia bacterium]
MTIFNERIKVFFIVILSLLIPVNLNGKTLETKPDNYDRIYLGTAFVSLLSLHYLRMYVGPENPHIINPLGIDVSARNSLLWQNSTQTASFLSDLGVVSLVSGAFWIPALTNMPYYNGFHIIAESAIYSGLLAQLVKILTGRQRPYSYYKTRESNDVDKNYSFFSGHTSIAFAAATSGGLLLSEKYSQYKIPIFLSGYVIAALCGYLRIASDSHYLSDVLTGAVIGTSIGYGIYQLRKSWISAHTSSNENEKTFSLSKKISF